LILTKPFDFYLESLLNEMFPYSSAAASLRGKNQYSLIMRDRRGKMDFHILFQDGKRKEKCGA
jgi:hypothetical protein